MKLGQSVVPYALNSQKRVTHSTIKVLHQPTSSECVTTFPCSLPRACPNDNEGKLQKFAMLLVVQKDLSHPNCTRHKLHERTLAFIGFMSHGT